MLADLLAATNVLTSVKDALPVIMGLIVIEGLLSVDNALAIAAMASHLDEKKRKLAMNIWLHRRLWFPHHSPACGFLDYRQYVGEARRGVVSRLAHVRAFCRAKRSGWG